jgi:serine O-acetyltransferase
MNWLAAYRRDIGRYTQYSDSSALIQVLTEQGLWALFQYRLATAIYHNHRLPVALRRGLLLLMVFWKKAMEIVTGISLPYTAVIGPGLFIAHYGNVILNDAVVLGEDCNLSQGVTIGVSGRGARRGVPQIGNRVYISANAVVAGRIYVGDDVMIGGNSLVTSNVPPHTTVVGVPAVVINNHGSEDYMKAHDTAANAASPSGAA